MTNKFKGKRLDESERRFASATHWLHMFPGGQMARTRWVFDLITKNLVLAEVSNTIAWRPVSKMERQHLLNNLLAIKAWNPGSEYSIDFSDNLPTWANLK